MKREKPKISGEFEALKERSSRLRTKFPTAHPLKPAGNSPLPPHGTSSDHLCSPPSHQHEPSAAPSSMSSTLEESPRSPDSGGALAKCDPMNILERLNVWGDADIGDVCKLEENPLPKSTANLRSSYKQVSDWDLLKEATTIPRPSGGVNCTRPLQNIDPLTGDPIGEIKVRTFNQYKSYSIALDKFQPDHSSKVSDPPSVTPSVGAYTVNSRLLQMIRGRNHGDLEVVKAALARWNSDMWDMLRDPCPTLNCADFIHCLSEDLSNSASIQYLSAARANLVMARLRVEVAKSSVDPKKVTSLLDLLPEVSQHLANDTSATVSMRSALVEMQEGVKIMEKYSNSVMHSTMSRLTILEQRVESRLASVDGSLSKLTCAFEKLAGLDLKNLSLAVAGLTSAANLPTRTPTSAAVSSYVSSRSMSKSRPPAKIDPINRVPTMN